MLPSHLLCKYNSISYKMPNETCIYFITISPRDIIRSLLRADRPQLEAATQALSNFSTRRGGGAHPESGCDIDNIMNSRAVNVIINYFVEVLHKKCVSWTQVPTVHHHKTITIM